VIAQFELELADRRKAVPWGGRSPRDLTREGIRRIFEARAGEKHESFFVDPDQFDLFRAAIRGRRRYGGAPTLLPLPRERLFLRLR